MNFLVKNFLVMLFCQSLFSSFIFSSITQSDYKQFNDSYYASEFKQKGWCKLVYAMSINKFEIARYLIEQGDDVNLLITGIDNHILWNTPSILTPFYTAIAMKNVDLVRLCLSHGGNLEPLPEFGSISPVHIAVTYGNAEVTDLLLSYGANPNSKDYFNRTPLHTWTTRLGIYETTWEESNIKEWRSQNKEILMVLLQHQVDINALSKDGRSVLSSISDIAIKEHPTSHQEGMELLYLLLDLGCLVNFDNPFQGWGQQPLFQAIQNTCHAPKVANVLLQYGADPNWNNGNDTPLTQNSIIGNETLAQMLIEFGANVELEDRNGYTPLIKAILNKKTSIVKALLENGANVKNKGHTGKLPLDIAYENGLTDIIDLILSAQFSK